MIRTTRPAAVLAALALSLTGLTLTSAPAEAATTPTFASRNGITVHSVKPITSRTLELLVGRDLQFIRINGSVVGALAGLLIHTLATLLF